MKVKIKCKLQKEGNQYVVFDKYKAVTGYGKTKKEAKKSFAFNLKTLLEDISVNSRIWGSARKIQEVTEDVCMPSKIKCVYFVNEKDIK